MWCNFLQFLTFSIFFNGIICKQRKNLAQIALEQEVVSIKNYVFWPNATVPFYVNPEHFDHEQSLAILTALSMFAFKSCLKFAPVMAAPQSDEHVMVFENPNGVRRCVVDTVGHSVFEPHRVVLGYDCLQSPNIDMMIMRSLGFPFEHNKPSRAVYVDVLHENIEPGHTDLFTLEAVQAMELSALPYDINSVMHFGDRDYSKNGHRTIMFKDPNMKQNKVGLTHMDLRKIDAVYGPECRTRDRQEKLDLCQSYPGVARRKREADEVEPAQATVEPKAEKDIKLDKEHKKEGVEVFGNTKNEKTGIKIEGDENVKIKDIEEQKSGDSEKLDKNVVSEDIKIDVTKSLRINPNITPPPHVQLISLNAELGIADGLQDLVDHVFKISKLALSNAREKYCFNNTVGIRPSTRSTETNATDTDIFGIVDLVVQYINGMVNHAKSNLTQFCQESESIDRYSRYGCNSGNGRDCPKTYRSTKSGAVRYSTQHRPTFYQSTKITYHQRNIFEHISGFRKKRSVDVEAVTEQLKKVDDKANNDDNNDVHKAKVSRNDDNVNTYLNKAQDDNNGKDAAEISSRDEDDGAIKRNKEIDIDGEGTGKIESNNETRGGKTDVEIQMKNENEAEDINQAEELKNGNESKNFGEKLTIKVDQQPIRRRDRQYRRKEYGSSVSAERDINLKYKGPSSEVDKKQRDSRQYKAELEREKVEEEQLKYRLELKRQRDEEYDKKFQKHLPEWSNELTLMRDQYTTKRVISSTNTDRTTHKVQNIPTSAENANKSNIKRMRDRHGNKRIKPIETYERDRENKKYSYTEERKYNKNNKDSTAEYDDEETKYKRHKKTKPKEKKYDDEETEYKRPDKTKPKGKKYDVQSESVESEKREKRMSSKKARQIMTMKMKKGSDGESDERISRENKRKEDNEKQQSVEDEIANRDEQPSGEQSSEISGMNLPRLVKLSKANEEFYKDRRWPGGEVRYLIQEDTTYDMEDLRRRIKEVNDILKKKTCVYLKEVTADEATEYEDYLLIDNSPDYVTGRVGGRQKFGSIELFLGNQHRQHTAMMVMAWLGFYFEVSRHDRDKYVRVHMRHIRPDKLHHFEKIRDDATLNLPYDYASATHPAWQYWRQIGRKGISSVATYKHKDPEGTIMRAMGQNEKLLSDIDIIKINSVYGLSCKRHERAKVKAETREKEREIKREHDTSSSNSSSSSTEDLSE